MNKINVAIIEDEIPAARLLHSMVSGLRPQWELTLIPGSVDEAVAWFDEHPHPDLIFLDIHLADGNAFDFLSAAHPSSVIIFTTAYDQYAIRAFTVNSIDYILKPIDEKRLSDAITKYESLLTNAVPRPEDYLGTLLEALQYKEKRYRTRFLIFRSRSFLVVTSGRYCLFLFREQSNVCCYPQRSGTYSRFVFKQTDGTTRSGAFLSRQPPGSCLH